VAAIAAASPVTTPNVTTERAIGAYAAGSVMPATRASMLTARFKI
jgi:hypothetical protein